MYDVGRRVSSQSSTNKFWCERPCCVGGSHTPLLVRLCKYFIRMSVMERGTKSTDFIFFLFGLSGQSGEFGSRVSWYSKSSLGLRKDCMFSALVYTRSSKYEICAFKLPVKTSSSEYIASLWMRSIEEPFSSIFLLCSSTSGARFCFYSIIHSIGMELAAPSSRRFNFNTFLI